MAPVNGAIMNRCGFCFKGKAWGTPPKDTGGLPETYTDKHGHMRGKAFPSKLPAVAQVAPVLRSPACSGNGFISRTQSAGCLYVNSAGL